MAYKGAVDGMFTDVLVFGELTEGKVLSTPEDPSKGVVTGIETVCEEVDLLPGSAPAREPRVQRVAMASRN